VSNDSRPNILFFFTDQQRWDTCGCYRNNIALPLDAKTIAHWCSEAGYEVGYIGKWHLASDENANYREMAVPPERRGGWKDYWLAADVLEFTSHGYDGHMFDADMNRVDFKGYRVDCVTDFALDYLRTRAACPRFSGTSGAPAIAQAPSERYTAPSTGWKMTAISSTKPATAASAAAAASTRGISKNKT
jgi:arylsulfatase A-like enzyme